MAVHTTENKVQGAKGSQGRITYKEIWMGPWSLYALQPTLRKNVQRSRKVIQETAAWQIKSTSDSANRITGTMLGKGFCASPNDQSYKPQSPELSALIQRGKSYAKPATSSPDSFLSISPLKSTSPFFSCPYFPYFSCPCSDPSAPSTVYLLSVSSFQVFSLAPRSSCWAARSLVQRCNSLTCSP